MKTTTLCTVITVWLFTLMSALAQENQNATSIAALKEARERVVTEEKDALRTEVEQITLQLENNTISETEAEELKMEAAEKRALNIENRLAIIDNKIALLERNKEEDIIDDDSGFEISFGNGEEEEKKFLHIGPRDKPRPYDRRTTSDFVLAVGFNNVITEGESLEDSDFKIAGSRFAEIGWAWKTRVFDNSNWLRVKYGFSFQFNGLKPTDNRYYVDTGAETELQEFPIDLEKSKFRIDNLVIPVHFEFGPSRKIEKEDYFRYSTHNQIKVGLGGYAGIKLGARQKLKYEDDGEDVKEKLTGNYNTSNFIYGLSGYIGWRGTALYVKYDLNTIFKDNPIEQRNISLGLRFDMD